MAELTIHALQWCAQHVHPVLALRVRHSERIFVVALSEEDATALTPRPNHGTGQGNLRLLALVESAITCLGARAVAVSLRVGDDSVLSASLRLDGPTGVREVQTHFADGVALAHRARLPLLMDDPDLARVPLGPIAGTADAETPLAASRDLIESLDLDGIGGGGVAETGR